MAQGKDTILISLSHSPLTSYWIHHCFQIWRKWSCESSERPPCARWTRLSILQATCKNLWVLRAWRLI